MYFTNKSGLLLALLLGSLVLLFTQATVPLLTRTVATKPNIIIILADDLGWNDISCYGNTYHETPNLDKLAANGVRFTDAYAAASICSPTRASLLTGKYPARLQLTDWLPGRQHEKPVQASDKLIPPAFAQQLALTETTIAEFLKTQGYATASIGKWHLGPEPYYPKFQGFDWVVAGTHHGSPPSYFYPYATPKGDYQFKELADTGKPDEYLTDRLTNEAISFIQKNNQQPFFLYLPHYAVHIPLQAKENLIEKYTRKTADTTQVYKNPYYAAMVQSLDEGVGKLMNALKAAKIDQNTLIIFTSDNGGLAVKEGKFTPATLNGPLRDGKGYLSEGGIRVPLIMQGANFAQKNKVTNTVVSSIDIFPTIQELVAGPNNTNHTDGVSLVSFLQKKQALARKAIYWHYPHYSNQGGRPSGAIRKQNFKLIEYFDNNELELFDLAQDIGEQHNLVATMPGKAKELSHELKAWRKSVKAQMPAINPDYTSTAIKP